MANKQLMEDFFMFLLEHLQNQLKNQDSMFEAQLLREDIARLEKLQKIISTTSTVDEFKKAGMVVGWTKGDLRTFEMKEPLERFLQSFYAYVTMEQEKDELTEAWQEFNQLRRKILLHCL